MREELYHPILIHFPVGLLVLALLFWLFSRAVKVRHSELGKAFEWSYLFCLYIGAFFLGISLFTGDIAADVVKFQIEKPLEIQAHEESAYLSLYGYIAVIVLEATRGFIAERFRRIVALFIFTVLILSTYFLMETVHDGASLVYKQGAGVK